MEVAERRAAIMRMLCRRRRETIGNLARELGVSVRTIRRDIEALSLYEPIYTQAGRFVGGVYVVDGYNYDRIYMDEKEISVLHKLLHFAETNTSVILSSDEISLLKRIIEEYNKPQVKKERGESDD